MTGKAGRATRRPLAAGLLAMLALASLPAAAQWQWRGPDGRMTISDRPPPREIPERDIVRRPGTALKRPAAAATPASAGSAAGAEAAGAAAAASAPPTALDRSVQERRRAEAQAQAAKVKADEERHRAQRDANCQAARRHLAQVDSGMRIVTTNDRGEREVLDDRARAEQAARAREVMASDCR